MVADPSPETPGTMSARRASATALAGVLGAVALMLLLVTWAATIGPDEVLRGEGNPPSYETLPTSETAEPADPTGNTGSPGNGQQDLLLTIVSIVVTVLGAVVMLAVVLSVLRWLLTRDWRRHRREPEPEEIPFDPLDAPEQIARTMMARAKEQRAALAEGSPRNAIVACWHQFEEQAAAAGVRRQTWETSSEFTLRVLDRLAADSAAVTTLAELYRAARHSTHEITEADRAEAQVALDLVHRSLGRYVDGVSA
jgi:predicted RNA-binding Zn ribbon-like protein